MGSSAFLRFGASEAQEIVTANTEMHHKREKALVNQGLSADFNDKKKTVGRYDCKSTVPYLVGEGGFRTLLCGKICTYRSYLLPQSSIHASGVEGFKSFHERKKQRTPKGVLCFFVQRLRKRCFFVS